jgi:hypothetical protein
MNPYMVTRWISMVSPAYCAIINKAYNEKYQAFDDKQMLFDFLMTILPKRNIQFSHYIKPSINKKAKVINKKLENTVDELAASLEMSKREIRSMIENDPEFEKSKETENLTLYKVKSKTK